MKRTIIQITQVLAILVVVLMIPLIVESNSLRSGIKKQPELTLQGATSTNVLGVSTTSVLQPKRLFNFAPVSMNSVAIYILVPLIIVSVLSFAKYKVTKRKV